MKKILPLSLASILLLSSCSAGDEEILLPPVQEHVSALATASSKEMKMNKVNSKTVKKSEVVLTGGKNLGTKPASKTINNNNPEVKITYTDVKASNSLASDASIVANLALRAMDASKTWEDGTRLGERALEDLGRQGVYTAKLTYYAEKSAITWEDAYKITALGLSNIAKKYQILQIELVI